MVERETSEVLEWKSLLRWWMTVEEWLMKMRMEDLLKHLELLVEQVLALVLEPLVDLDSLLPVAHGLRQPVPLVSRQSYDR